MKNRHVPLPLRAALLAALMTRPAAAQGLVKQCDKAMADAEAMAQQVASCSDFLQTSITGLKAKAKVLALSGAKEMAQAQISERERSQQMAKIQAEMKATKEAQIRAALALKAKGEREKQAALELKASGEKAKQAALELKAKGERERLAALALKAKGEKEMREELENRDVEPVPVGRVPAKGDTAPFNPADGVKPDAGAAAGPQPVIEPVPAVPVAVSTVPAPIPSTAQPTPAPAPPDKLVAPKFPTTIKGFTCEDPIGSGPNVRAIDAILDAAKTCLADAEDPSRVDPAEAQAVDARAEKLARLNIRVHAYLMGTPPPRKAAPAGPAKKP
jgi:hypothetical protein